MFQFNFAEPVRAAKDKLDLAADSESADMFSKVPFNIASYALLLSIVAQVADRGGFIIP